MFSNEKKHLEVRFNPENIYCRKATGEKVSGTGMLLKVRVKKNPKSGVKEVQETSIMGISQETHQFNNLMDYNYIPLQKVKGNLECIYNQIVPSGILPSSYIEENKNVPLFLPPPVFSRIEIPQTGLFKKPEVSEGSSKDENVIGINRSRRKNYATCTRFTMTDQIPAKPHKFAFDSFTLKVVSQEKIDAVRQTFVTRPVWTRLGLIENSKVSAVDVKTILPILAYYYSSGPWRPCWVRFGYDPREDFEARKYQPLDFRYKGISLTKRESNKKESVDGNSSIFTEDTIPDTKLTFYQYCDVQVPKIQELLNKVTKHGAKCDEKRGWLPQGFQEQCREIMGEIVKSNFMKVYQRELVDFESTVADDDLDDGEEDLEDDEIFDVPESDKMDVDD